MNDENREYYRSLIKETHAFKNHVIPDEFKTLVNADPEVKVWLSKIGFKTRKNYLNDFCLYLQSINLSEPCKLLDLKSMDDAKNRFFPAEQLLDYWIVLAKESHIADNKILKISCAVKSFFKHNRVRLMDVKVAYRPREKPTLCREDLMHFRENMSRVSKVFIDFLISVPVRDGQFSICPNCGRDFHPKWSNIIGFPHVEEYSPFVILPEKGHESNCYSAGLRQVCFLTKTCAEQLNDLRSYRERVLGRSLVGSEYIFTHTKHSGKGIVNVSPLKRMTIQKFFISAQERSGLRVYPHLLRSYVNTILAACGIDKQVRDIYLGHSCAYEEGYVLQMIPVWQQMFKQKHALEALDLLNATHYQVVELERKIQKLENDIPQQARNLLNELAAEFVTKKMALMEERLSKMEKREK